MRILPIHLREFEREYLKHSEILEFLAAKIQCWSYLELGVGIGANLINVAQHSRQAIGVDVEFRRFWKFQYKYNPNFELPNNIELVKQTTDDFFADRKSSDLQFDLSFIDADHNFKQVVKDFHNVEPMMIKGGIIAIHDTFPISQKYTRCGKCGDSYKMLHYLRKYRLETFTIPINPGLTLIRKISNQLEMV